MTDPTPAQRETARQIAERLFGCACEWEMDVDDITETIAAALAADAFDVASQWEAEKCRSAALQDSIDGCAKKVATLTADLAQARQECYGCRQALGETMTKLAHAQHREAAAWWSDGGPEQARFAALTADLAQARQELGIREHEAALIEADTQRGITDCSTPLFQRVRNIVEALAAAEQSKEMYMRQLDSALEKLREANELNEQAESQIKAIATIDVALCQSAARTALQDAATEAETFGLMTGSQIAEWLRYRTE